jgi:hypothetical protein
MDWYKMAYPEKFGGEKAGKWTLYSSHCCFSI